MDFKTFTKEIHILRTYHIAADDSNDKTLSRKE